ncbi:hypothetical protein H4219_001292 [Mycoemilia scoparia]|uniref:Tripeptidyl-peptidase II n=1 Tax=Mycoemilia scoparia TaxID=417184 RepID=A0A9W8A8I8_9FUNG|nr:hypothetical protein H4219_001292 [Mycoemilia scoparia]
MAILDGNPLTPFPVNGLMPTEDTQASAFIKKYPEYDGRNTVVAVLDTGIDPMAENLQASILLCPRSSVSGIALVTTDGKPKIIDMIDCTGAGDVSMSKPKTAAVADNGTITVTGLSGRTLTLSKDWKNPSSEFRLGMKFLYDLLPSDGIRPTLVSERRKSFMKKHQAILDNVERELAKFNEEHPKESDLSEADQAKRDDIIARKKSLNELVKEYVDRGPVLDCISFHDGENWRAVVDTTTDGDLRDLPLMTDYSKEHQVTHLLKRFEFYYSVNFYDDGDVLSIVTVVGSHSTHVAGIIGAHDPNDSAMNGVAPGAQLISLKIGDNRVSSLETGPALTRASNAIIKHKADLANMSFGESAATPNHGFWVSLLKKYVIRTHRCIFVSSAGNEGPAFSTVGAPGGTTEDVIGVGAYVGHAQMEAEYALMEPVPETMFTWSSRGPSPVGYRGVDIYAPGSAITSYPRYTKQKYIRINGTSMSSPNLCGCLALLISGMKAKGLQYSPYSIRSAITNTSKPIGDPINVGFVQVDNAWSYLNKYGVPVESGPEKSLATAINDQDVAYKISITEGGISQVGGVYMRSLEECSFTQTRTVTITPKFLMDPDADYDVDVNGTNGQSQHLSELSFDKRIVIVTTQSWIKAPDFFHLNAKAKTFNMQVNPKDLEVGSLHYGEIRGFDSSNPDRGPLFTIPVTVLKPEVPGSSCAVTYNSDFYPGKIFRKFIQVPESATIAHIKITNYNSQESTPAAFYIFGNQIHPQRRHNYSSFRYRTGFSSGSSGSGEGLVEVKNFIIKVTGGMPLDLAVAQFWSEVGNHTLEVKVVFDGVSVLSASKSNNGESPIFIDGHSASSRLDLQSLIRRIPRASISAKLTTNRHHVFPKKVETSPLNERDVIPNGTRLYELVLTYQITATNPGAKVTLIFSPCDNYLYDSWFEGKMIQVYDANKKIIAAQTIYPKQIILPKKGDYTVHVQVRHSSMTELEKLRSSPLFVDTDLDKPLVLPIRPSFNRVFTNSGAKSDFSIEKGAIVPVFVSSLLQNPLPKDIKAGDLYIGNVSVLDNRYRDPNNFTLYWLAPANGGGIGATNEKEATVSSVASSSGDLKKLPEDSSSSTESKDELQELENKVNDLKIDTITKIKDEKVQKSIIDQLNKSLKKDSESYLRFLKQQMAVLDKNTQVDPLASSDGNEAKPNNGILNVEVAPELIKLAEKAIESASKADTHIPTKIKELGLKSQTPQVKEEIKKLEERQSIINTALVHKCRALVLLANSGKDATSSIASSSKSNIDLLEETLAKLKVSLGANSGDLPIHYIESALSQLKGQNGSALLQLNKWLASRPLNNSNKSRYNDVWDKRVDLLKALDWKCWVDYFNETKIFERPSSFRQF